MNRTDEIVGQCLLWGDLRYLTIEEFEAYKADQEKIHATHLRRLGELEAEVTALKATVTRLEADR